MTSQAEAAGAAAEGAGPSEAVYRKIRRRIVPFLFVCYMVSYFDRTNVSFAQFGLRQDLGFGVAAYGLGAGIFFLGYIVFEIPSNFWLARSGARKTMLRLMVGWGVASAATAFITAPWHFYAVRFALGMAEAGFFPGALLYMTFWAPPSQRGRFTALFMVGGSISGVIGSPLSGWIMHAFGGVAGLKAWQWLFILEGLPACLLGVLAYFYLDDGPRHARWLTDREKSVVLGALQAEDRGGDVKRHASFRRALRSRRLYVLSFVAFVLYSGAAGVFFWVPLIMRGAGVGDLRSIGLLTAVPFIAAVVAQLLNGRHSDRARERRRHAAFPLLLGALGWIMLPLASASPFASVVLLTVAAAGTYAGMPVFWAMPPTYLSGTAAAGGIALLSSVGSLGGFVSSSVIGFVTSLTGQMAFGQIYMALLLIAGATAILLGVPRAAEPAPVASGSAA